MRLRQSIVKRIKKNVQYFSTCNYLFYYWRLEVSDISQMWNLGSSDVSRRADSLDRLNSRINRPIKLVTGSRSPTGPRSAKFGISATVSQHFRSRFFPFYYHQYLELQNIMAAPIIKKAAPWEAFQIPRAAPAKININRLKRQEGNESFIRVHSA